MGDSLVLSIGCHETPVLAQSIARGLCHKSKVQTYLAPLSLPSCSPQLSSWRMFLSCNTLSCNTLAETALTRWATGECELEVLRRGRRRRGVNPPTLSSQRAGGGRVWATHGVAAPLEPFLHEPCASRPCAGPCFVHRARPGLAVGVY